MGRPRKSSIAHTPNSASVNGPSRGNHGPMPNGSTPPQQNGRRMTSNPNQGTPNGMNGSPGHPYGQVQNHPNGPPQSFSTSSLANYHGNGIQNGIPHSGSAPPGQSLAPGAGSGPASASMQTRPHSQAPSSSYPWSTRPIRLYTPETDPPTLPQSPFPRYGLSVPAFPSHSGHLLLFGGLVHENVKNDLWSIDVRDCTTSLVRIKGEAPIPRVGHASAIADKIMLVWGGDTKVRPEDAQDEGLYILDLRTQEWTSVPISPGPVGRYGHAVSMLDSRFFVFGGQAEGSFMNDLWAYDIMQLGVSGGPHRWESIQYTTPPPPRRTGHILTAHQGKLYLFGGTDGMYHYNDTWCFDIATGAWTELSCIGYIPVPREGHAAAIVDDVIYIIGGRDVNGKDLGDLAAFRITNQRWYMFQNMGPCPSPRSGHAMVAAHGKVFVVGGEANASSAQSRDDPSLIHILDTTKIKYPPDNVPPRQVKARVSEVSSHQHMPDKAASPPQSTVPLASRQMQNGPSSSTDHGQSQASSESSHPAPPPQSQPPLLAPIVTPTSVPAEQMTTGSPQPMAPHRAPPPQRPRREGDEEYRRAMSPTNVGPSSPNQQANLPVPSSTSPGMSSSSPPQPRSGFNSSILGTRSPSPRLRTSDGDVRPAPPPDAFYYGRSPTSASGRPGSLSGQGDFMREIKAKDGEIEAGRKREAALKVIIGRAIHQGFVDDETEDLDLPNNDGSDHDPEIVRKLADALVRLKKEKAAIQTEMVAQMTVASERAVEADRLRRGALQEAAFLRAKLATLESNSPIELARIEKERINELERQLGHLHADHANSHRELQRALSDSSASRDLHSAAVQRESETLRRAEDAEEAHRAAMEELDETQHRMRSAESGLREHTEKLANLSSVAQQREAERDQLQHQLDEAIHARDAHLKVIEEAQLAITASGARTSEMEELHSRANERVRLLEEELSSTRSELEIKTKEAESAVERLAEIEAAYHKSRDEAESLRLTTTSQLGQLLESHRDLQASESRTNRGHQEQIRALEEEGNSLRKMLKEAGQRLDAAESGVSHHRQKSRDLESAHQTLRADLRGHRTKLLKAQEELARYRDMQASKDAELKDRDLAVTEMETKCSMLRNLLSDHGIAVDDMDLANGESSSRSELESQLRERTRACDNAQREIDDLTRRCHEAEDKVESLGRLIERMKDARSPTAMSARSPSPPVDSDRRVMEAERKMAELENQHKEKMAALEGDYQTAVRYVKGTEKMLKRMKDELNKQKDSNKTLQAEIDHLTGRSSEAGARTREASGRSTPSSAAALADPELTRRLEKLQNQHSALQAELSASRDVLAAREREVDVLRMRCEDAEREVEALREDLSQAQQRINTLLEMGGASGYHSNSEDEDEHIANGRRGSAGSSEEASMAFDKFTKELKQWERSRSPPNGDLSTEDETSRLGPLVTAGPPKISHHVKGHKRNSSEYSADWVQ
ncbi:hypothetical protein BD324DRAFT_648753 [Kockovaella imperatae]|uniref:Uncharacterized protein n=1 Tax=Kockovaella imperatae TaxID=4999 RepID=A0A1Y1UQ37_9TREE|nr:hypothetical protein BD324DRAFT_648753 [Kockovaella imperatae]ORX40151.1 hypothetical protein BD324DRAFT_648753 [Kockovaella imperatae]